MDAAEQATRIKILHAMGLGPMWLSRYASDETAPVVVTPAFADTPPAVVLADAGIAAPVSLVDVPPAPVTVVSEPVESVSGMSWETLQAEVASCVACGLCKGRAKTVFGAGDTAATWLFVGEGPGYNENIQGEPFVGAAGQLLDNMLHALGIRRGDRAYIANVVKCRPTDSNGKDRPPTPAEIQACLPYLRRQIALIQPKVIVALGKTAAVALLGVDPETPVSQLRDKEHHLNGVPMVVTYHPAYLLRKPVEKSKAWRDLCLARKALPGSA
ncbi:uracil-DNA glycosylase [Undibacterium sp. WLHG33]|uniref:uracil-DNA glycosylase n=1 Tax=Undibacterium sp. WLHG33 TaxID=3412482 RepID=UPI003C2C54AB